MPLGFEKVAYKALEFPGPVDANRVLVVPMATDVPARLKGVIEWRDIRAQASASIGHLSLKVG
ncbi:hypothetical protein D3C86_2218680 [compost metagenome]